MEVVMPSGYTVERESLDGIPADVEPVKRTEMKNSETVAVIYFDEIGAEELKISLRAIQTVEVKELKPASITVYDYYDSCECTNIMFADFAEIFLFISFSVSALRSQISYSLTEK